MTFMRTIFFILASIITAAGTSVSYAAVHNVSTSAALQAALDKAVAGDEIVLADGTYAGEFYIRSFSGSSTAPITVRAANKHKAIMQGTNACDRFQEGFVISKSWWTIKDLKFRDHGRALSIYAPNVEFSQNIIDHFREEGVRVENTNGANIHDNVITNGDACQSDAPGIYLVNNADGNVVLNNLIFATGDNGYTFGNKLGYGLLIANDSDDNLVQGNLLFANGGKGTLRILGGKAVSSVSRNILKDNALLWGEGEQSSNDCVDDSNQFLNNIFYGTYQALWSTKGNFDGTKGNHLIKNNLFYTDAFTRIGASLGTGGEPFCDNPIVNYKINNIVQDNIFFSPDRQSDWHRTWLVWGDTNSAYPALKRAGNNLFWAPGTNPVDWVYGYSFRPTDIREPNNRPIFTNALEGDFSLASGSSGKNGASDGKDIGLEYNTYLKKDWLKNAFTLATQEKQGVTSAAFPVNASKFYQVWFYIPESSPYQGIETFNIEGRSLQRDIHGLTTGSTWVQPGGPARWITLGRHRASDGTLNISWSNSGSASKIFIRELPTADEAYSWISGTATTIPPPPPPPPTTTSVAIPARIEAEAFSLGGQGTGYNDTTSANLGGAYRRSEAVDIKLAPGGVGYTVGYTDAGEWLKYDVNVSQSGNYSITARGANGATTNGNFRIEVDGVNATGTISIPPTGSYSTEATVNGPTIPLAQGPHTLRVYFESSNFDLNWIELSASSVGSIPKPPSNVALTAQ